MRIDKKTLIGTALMALSQLASGAAAEKPALTPGAVLRDESRIYIGECLIPLKYESDIQFFVAPAIGAALIEPLVDIVLGSIQAAAQDETVTVDSPFPITKALYALKNDGSMAVNSELQCLQVVTGSFSADELRSPSATPDSIEPVEILKRRDPSIEQPRLIFEAAFVRVPGSDNAMALAPRLLLYAGGTKQGFWEIRQQPRNLSISLSFQSLAAESGTAFGNVSLPFRAVPPDTFLGPAYFRQLSLKPILLPPLPKAEQDAIDVARAEMAEANRLFEAPQPRHDVRLDNSYLNSLSAYCASWDSYVTLLRKRHAENKTAGNFSEPGNENCSKEIRQQQLTVEAKKAELDAIVSDADRARIVQRNQAKGNSKNIECNATQCVLADKFVRNYLPFTVSASVVEMREASAFMKHLATVADKIKPAVVATIKEATPQAKSAAAKTVQSAADVKVEQQLKDTEDYYLAKAKADDAFDKWNAAESAEKSTEWLKVLPLRIEANRAARKAQLPSPFTM